MNEVANPTYYSAMKKLPVVAVVMASLSLVVSGWALWRSYDTTDATGRPTSSTSTTVAPGSTTTIPLVVVPTEVGKNGMAAALNLKGSKLKSSIVEAPSVNVSKGYVISQRPQQGTEVPVGTVIELTISSGPP